MLKHLTPWQAPVLVKCVRWLVSVAAVVVVPLLVFPFFSAFGVVAEAPSHHQPPKGEKPAMADNSPCLVCHGNFEEEPLSRRHAKADVGCVKCHGESEAHRSDENNTTPPDRMFPRSEIDRACRHCHTTHNVPGKVVIAAYLAHCRHIANPEKITCTECHGEHRMNHRTILWDKRTGRLLAPGEKPAE